MLTRIRNAQAVYKKTVDVPFSNFKFKLAQLLLKNGYLERVTIVNNNAVKKSMTLALKYENSKPFIRNIRRISKGGQRIYTKRNEIHNVLSGYGMRIISTPQGLMTNKEAKKKGFGGEVIAEIW